MRHPACNKRGWRSEGVCYLLQVDGIASKSQYRRSNEQLQPIQSVLPGWYISVLVMVGGDPLLVRVVDGV